MVYNVLACIDDDSAISPLTGWAGKFDTCAAAYSSGRLRCSTNLPNSKTFKDICCITCQNDDGDNGQNNNGNNNGAC